MWNVQCNLYVKADIIEDEKLNYTIVDISGRIMASGTTTSVMNSNDISINTSNLNEGTYFVKFDSKYRSFTKAIQVSKQFELIFIYLEACEAL